MTLTHAEWTDLQVDPILREALGRVFKELRGKSTQESLASSAAVTPQTVRRIEQGRAFEISLDMFLACARAVGVEGEQILARARAAPAEINSSLFQLRGALQAGPIGRDADRDEIGMILQSSRGVVLYGAPGQGKTALARYVGIYFAGRFRHGVYEVDLASERQIENLPRLIANELGQPDLPSSYELLRGRSILLILDSVDQLLQHTPPERFRETLSAITRSLALDGRLLITCQSKLEKQELATREVGPLRADAAVELFHQVSDSVYRTESAIDLAKFVRDLLGGHPLSIKIVARYGRTVGLPLDYLWRLWEEKWSAIAVGSPLSLDDRALRPSFELTFEALPNEAKWLLLTLGLLPDGISANLIKEVWPDREIEIYDAIRILRDRSLLEDGQDGLNRDNRLRGPLFQFAITKLQDPVGVGEQLARDVLETATMIDSWFDHYITSNAPQFGDTDPRKKNQLIREHFHNIHASLDRRLEPSIAATTLAAAQGVLSLYWAYHNNLSGARNPISSTEDAIKYLEKAHAIFIGNNRSSDANRCMYYIGNILWLRGDITRAQRYLFEAKSSADVTEKDTCDILRAFAHIEYKEGNIAVSVDKYVEVLKRALGKYDDCVFRCWVGLLDAYRKLGRLDDAFELMVQIEPQIGACPAEVLGNLRRGHAYALATAGFTNEATTEYYRALEAFQQNPFGQAHCWRGLGDILIRDGKLDEADTAFNTAMRLYDEAHKNPSLGVALVMLGRGRLMQARGDLEGALQLYRKAAGDLDRQHLNEPYELAVAHELIGDTLAAAGDARKARAEYGISMSYFARVGATQLSERIRAKLA